MKVTSQYYAVKIRPFYAAKCSVKARQTKLEGYLLEKRGSVQIKAQGPRNTAISKADKKRTAPDD